MIRYALIYRLQLQDAKVLLSAFRRMETGECLTSCEVDEIADLVAALERVEQEAYETEKGK
jgi:hypothetical protein